jgi:hypothetical protein
LVQARTYFERALTFDAGKLEPLLGVGGHMWLGLVNIFTRRASLGIAECEHALALDRNLASAHAAIGFGRIGIARSEETSAATSKQSLGVGGRSRPAEAIATHILSWPPPSRSLID